MGACDTYLLFQPTLKDYVDNFISLIHTSSTGLFPSVSFKGLTLGVNKEMRERERSVGIG